MISHALYFLKVLFADNYRAVDLLVQNYSLLVEILRLFDQNKLGQEDTENALDTVISVFQESSNEQLCLYIQDNPDIIEIFTEKVDIDANPDTVLRIINIIELITIIGHFLYSNQDLPYNPVLSYITDSITVSNAMEQARLHSSHKVTTALAELEIKFFIN